MIAPLPPADIAPLSGRFVDRTHWFAVRVYYEDTDFSGIVYHANYLRYCERARSDMLRSIGIDQREAHENGTGVYAVSEMAIKYLRPAKLEDDLIIASQVTRLRAAACHIQQRVIRGDETLMTADVIAAFITPQGRPVRQPEPWMAAFQAHLQQG